VTATEYLVSPQEFVTASVLEADPCVEKLSDAMAPHMFCEVPRLVPVEGCPERQEAHGLGDNGCGPAGPFYTDQ
jgi:hypothetical protein